MASIGPFEPDSIIDICKKNIEDTTKMHQDEDKITQDKTFNAVQSCIRGNAIRHINRIKIHAEKAKELNLKIFLNETEFKRIEKYLKLGE
jgi:hypothetical protein